MSASNSTALHSAANDSGASDPARVKVITWTTFFSMTQGWLLLFFNGFLAFLIFRYPKLRQESHNRKLFGCLSIADALLGLAYICSATGFLVDPMFDNVHALECTKYPHVVLQWWGPQYMALCLTSVAFDRVVCVVNLKSYLKLGKRYLSFMVAYPLVITSIMFILFWVLAWWQDKGYNVGPRIICYRELVVPAQLVYVFDCIQVLGPLMASLSYVFVIIKLLRTPKSEFGGLAQVQKERELRTSKTLGILAATTAFCYSAPAFSQALIHYIPALTLPSGNVLLTTLNQVFSRTEACHSLLNFGIYVWRAEDIRLKIAEIFYVKKLCPGCMKVLNVQEETTGMPERMISVGTAKAWLEEGTKAKERQL